MESGGDRLPSQENESGRSAENAFSSRLSETLRREEQRLKELRAELEETVDRYTAELKRVREELERTLKDARIYAENIVNTVREPLLILDPALNIVSANRSFYAIFRTRPGDVEGKPLFELECCCHWNTAELRGLLESVLAEHKPLDGYEVTVSLGEAGYQTMLLNARQIYRGDTEQQLILLAIEDITERRRAEQQLQKAKELSDVLNNINTVIHSTLDFEEVMRRAVQEAGTALAVDAAVIGLLEAGSFIIKYGYRVPEEFIDAHVSPERFRSAQYAASARDVVVFNDSYTDDRLNQEDIRRFGIRSLLSAPFIRRGSVLGTINLYSTIPFFFTDYHVDFARKLAASLSLALENARLFEDRKRIEEEMRHMAHHDELTGLPNRRLFMDIIRVECAQVRRHRLRLALFFLDLDRFKEVNDTLGHEVGDRLLKEVAVRLRANVRESDTISRAGGDEFTITLADISRVEVIGEVAQKLTRAFQYPFMIAGHELCITVSIGISIYPDDSEDIGTLFRYADIALYHAKEQGRNNYQFYNPEITVRSIERIRLEGMLRQTVERGELEVHYQPQVAITTRRMVCAEALVRWRHPERGLLEAKQFIPAAEDTGLIRAIDEWVVRTACEHVRAWRESGLSPVCITVNLSARAFQNPDLVNTIAQILKETGTPPQHLDIEITETLAMSNVEQTSARLRELREMGMHTSLDDFGTGYSSLGYLKKLSVQKLKIDHSLIQDIATDPDDRAVISAVTAMAHTLGMKVLAEGVETEDQLSFLRTTHCDEAQGYLFSKPLPAEELKKLIASGR
ncbi:MAG: EAL domain-containing protein [Alphaproteobacteria bacterium]|uniref:EAL domain-containing protein n=1 Tax=Candidatus Nitrobium versatile TaxID=2884831 RepID=A0A953M1F2_9BACT|nr:EAL domain-containing protein [Candidatus Nitrobium versatile]